MTTANDVQTKVLIFQSFVTEYDYYRYANSYPAEVPFPLVDRSPCLDPFFDPYATPGDRQPVVSGLCRTFKNFREGDRFLYLTRIDRRVYKELMRHDPSLAIDPATPGTRYFGVAALRVIWAFDSHADAATDFGPRRYMVAPTPTPYPPNLAHELYPKGAVARTSCIVHDAKKQAHTPLESTEEMYRWQIRAYHQRQVDKGLRAALCEVEMEDGKEALRLDPASAPVFTRADWEYQPVGRGVFFVSEGIATSLRTRIAQGRRG